LINLRKISPKNLANIVKHKSGLFIAGADLYEKEVRKDEAVEVGTLVMMGDLAFKNLDGCDDKPWASIGDKVLFPAYAGRKFHNEADDHLYRIFEDQDIFGIAID
jgi:co-chaperonin GroES (HSP10)